MPTITTILAFLLVVMGLVMIAGGTWTFFILITEEEQVALAEYAIAIGTISGGLGMAGLAQALKPAT
jgi:hypothetical protein